MHMWLCIRPAIYSVNEEAFNLFLSHHLLLKTLIFWFMALLFRFSDYPSIVSSRLPEEFPFDKCMVMPFDIHCHSCQHNFLFLGFKVGKKKR